MNSSCHMVKSNHVILMLSNIGSIRPTLKNILFSVSITLADNNYYLSAAVLLRTRVVNASQFSGMVA